MRYDPRTKKPIPDDIPETAVGTMDELQKYGLSARIYPSCSEPSVDGTILGCSQWFNCTMSYKGKPLAEGGGPRSHCWERVKGPAQGGAIVRTHDACYWGVAQQEEVLENKGSLSPIADEGEEYEIDTVIAVPLPTDLTNRESRRVKRTVTPFVRIGESKLMANERMRQEIIQRETERIQRERPAEIYGISTGVTPLDKRRKGGSGGAQKKD